MIFLFLDSISTGEVFIILIFILIFFGSESIPNMARTFGRTLRQIRDATDDIKRDIRNSTSEIEKDLKNARDDIGKTTKDVSDAFLNKTKEFEDIGSTFKRNVESTGSETISNKRKPVTEKYIKKDDAKQAEKNIKNQPLANNSDSPSSKSEQEEKMIYEITEAEQEKNVSEISGTIAPEKGIKSKPDADIKKKIDKDPESE